MIFSAIREEETGIYRLSFNDRVRVFEIIDNRTMYRFDEEFHTLMEASTSLEDYYLYFSKYQILIIKNLKIGENCQFEMKLYNSEDANLDDPPLFAPPLVRHSNRIIFTYYTEDYFAEMNK